MTRQDARILIVDDVEENIDVLSRMLERAGYEQIWRTTDPLESLELFQSVDPHLLILDLEMPGMTGLEVMARIQEMTGVEHFVPTLILTGTTNPDAAWRCLAMGARDFVQKPFRGGELLWRVKNLLRAGSEHHVLDEEASELTSQPGFESPHIHAPPLNSAGAASEPLGVSADLVGTIAHDLNNLLTQISGYADLLQMEMADHKTADQETNAEDVAEIQRAVKQASAMTRELLTHAAANEP